MSSSETSSGNWFGTPQFYKHKAKVYGKYTPYKCKAPKIKWISMYLNDNNLKFKNDIIQYYTKSKLQQWGYV